MYSNTSDSQIRNAMAGATYVGITPDTKIVETVAKAVEPAKLSGQPRPQVSNGQMYNPFAQTNPEPQQPQVQFSGQTDIQESVIDYPDFTDEVAEPSQPEPQQTQSHEVSESDENEDDLPETPAAENFKKLRNSLKSERQAKRDLEAKLLEAEAERQRAIERVEKYDKGEFIPDVIKVKDQRIAELEKYETAVNIKFSPVYQDQIVKPMQALQEKLYTYGEHYNVSPDFFEYAATISNERDLNEFLSQRFDPVAGLEVNKLIKDIQAIGKKAQDLENKPQETIAVLRSQYEQREAEEANQRANVFTSVAKVGWSKALEKTQAEGAFKELVMQPGNSEYNRTVVEPIQHRASVQYTALVQKLHKLGIKELPEDFAVGLARMVQLSIGGAMTLEAKQKAEAKAEELIKNTERTRPYVRPSIGGSNGNSHNGNSPQRRAGPSTIKEAGAMALEAFKR